MNKYVSLISQLNKIIGLLEVSDEIVFQSIRKHDVSGTGLTIDSLYGYNYKEYQNHICCSAFLLGFSQFDDYVSEIIRKYYAEHPLENKYKFEYAYYEENKRNLIKAIAIEKVRNLGFTEKISLLKKIYPGLNETEMKLLRSSNDIRSCLVHNNGVADDKLMPRYKKGEHIRLNSDDVNRIGLSIREIAKKLYLANHIKTAKYQVVKKVEK
jgi:hypothetical protein